jgi:hypothetical protein
MSRRIIIHIYTPTCPGIGDYFRAVGHLYHYCNLHNINFYLDITNPIEKYFYYKRYTASTKGFDRIMTFHSHPDFIYNKFLKSPTNSIIITNKAIGEHRDEYISKLREIIIPNNYIITKHKQLLHKYNLTENKYSCIHIRFGDKFLVGSAEPDDRVAKKPLTISERIAKYLPYINKDYPIVLLADNYEQKKSISKAYNFIWFDIKPIHTSHNPTDAQTEQTVLEFLTIVECREVFMLSYSGFSKMAACYGNKPYHLCDS